MARANPDAKKVRIGSLELGPGSPPLLIAGPCVLEDLEISLEIGRFMAAAARKHGFAYMFKASYDKANRTSVTSYRGPGISRGLEILAQVKEVVGCPVISDIHEPFHAEKAAQILDCIQIPAFLCRQTDLLVAAGETGKAVNIKKGQFMAPWDMVHAIKKVESTGNQNLLLTERGVSFGYNNLVVDMRAIPIMAGFGYPVIFDATHSVQLPGGGNGCSSGQREFVPHLARAAMAAGADGIFMEVYPDPEKARCDGANSLPLDEIHGLLSQLTAIFKVI
ncbi:MAG: 3-deoxy-8-phosphooctulonate synthase [Thermodesulfatator sp.]|nr:MAG: 3-deoxy-8-phosphooctulonate synthase [Thermodesulfatator sp.]